MTGKHTILCHAVLVGLVALSSGCVVHEGSSAAREEGYRKGYYDREHNRTTMKIRGMNAWRTTRIVGSEML